MKRSRRSIHHSSSMPETVRDNRFTSLRATYDAAFAMLCHARKQLDLSGSEGMVEEDVRSLQRNLDVSQSAFTRARNDLAMYLLERVAGSHGKLIVSSTASGGIIRARMG